MTLEKALNVASDVTAGFFLVTTSDALVSNSFFVTSSKALVTSDALVPSSWSPTERSGRSGVGLFAPGELGISLAPRDFGRRGSARGGHGVADHCEKQREAAKKMVRGA